MSILRKDLAAAIQAAKAGASPADPVGVHYQVAADGAVLRDAAVLRDGSEQDLADTKRGAKA